MRKLFLLFVISSIFSSVKAQTENLPKTSAGFPINYKEDSVGNYVLPDLFTLSNGQPVKDASTWNRTRKPELLKLIAENEYGKPPDAPQSLHYAVFDKGTPAFNGKAIRKQVTIYLTDDSFQNKMDLLIYTPPATSQFYPLLLIVNFAANNQVVDDPGVKIGSIWTREGNKVKADQPSRFGKIDVESFMKAGIAVATVYYGDIEPDFKDGIKYGIRKAFMKPGQTTIGPNEWGAISAWSWGLSRALDYFQKDISIDHNRIALQGTSRLGKTVLWTGVRDPRFKLVIASCSGEGGAAISRRDYGENIKHITDTSRYYYQFAPAYHSFASHVNDLPFDAHALVALMAPRAILLQTGDTDYWSDPKGEWLSAMAAAPVFQLLGKSVPTTTQWPAAGDTGQLFNTLGYYMHKGGHGTIPADWPLFIEYIKKFL
jgi:hypothetical protein